jgi:two-component system, chemotaxis family, chemotaxis protein CheY
MARMETSVLVVDDHPVFRAAARRLLEAAGMTVVGEAASAAAALVAAARLRPDVVLLDVRLPDGDGFDVARGLGAAGVETTTVLVSSASEPAYPALASDVGAAGFLAKSELSPDALAALVARHRRSDSPAHDVGSSPPAGPERP